MLDIPVAAPRCRFCGGRNTNELRTLKDGKTPLWQCGDCLCGFQLDEDIERNGAARSYDAAYIQKYKDSPEAQRMRREEAEYFLDRYGAFVSSSLEIGVGDGTFSSVLASHGIHAAGVDLIPEAVASARSLGVAMLDAMDWEDLDNKIEGDTFDAGIMIHNIEHYDDPQVAFRELVYKVRKGGLLYVHTPNHDHAQDSNWFHYHLEHLCLFGERALAMLFDANDVRLIETRKLYGDDIIVIGSRL